MHEQGLTVFVILLLGGLFLIGAEIYVPGGVLGLIGAVSLLAAIVIAFLIFP
ncbi:MAG TPA: serine peptidase, partial [Lentisphaerae bacterium]|nr:serine peptidase [Lentisphaerota bacterium]